MITAKCPRCEKHIQIPDDTEETFCAYCGEKFHNDDAIISTTNIVLMELKNQRDAELSAFLNGPGFTLFHGSWGLPSENNAQIETRDPKDMVSKEMRICDEIRTMLYEACGEKGLFAPAGIRYIGNKVLVCVEYEALVLQHFSKINEDAQLLLTINPGYDFTPTKELFLDIVKLDKTPELYGLFRNGLVMAYLSLIHYFIPVAKKGFLYPLGDRLAEAFNNLAEMINLRMDPQDITFAHKVKVLHLNHLSTLK